VIQAHRNWRRYRRTHYELMRSSERDLRDVGICQVHQFFPSDVAFLTDLPKRGSA
jgi:hypothetical protein